MGAEFGLTSTRGGVEDTDSDSEVSALYGLSLCDSRAPVAWLR